MHRITEARGGSRVTALPGPVRTARLVKVHGISGQEIEIEQWTPEDDWQPVGQPVGGLSAVGQLRCSYCGCVGRMQSLGSFLYPDGYRIRVPRQEECPVCLGPMECIAVTDAI
ncbi:MAG: hypothetical protein JWO38_6353 [Gemmataceae bacterium]|nr:hypothetical protein [Gemmataceae bacterium]